MPPNNTQNTIYTLSNTLSPHYPHFNQSNFRFFKINAKLGQPIKNVFYGGIFFALNRKCEHFSTVNKVKIQRVYSGVCAECIRHFEFIIKALFSY